VKLHNVGLDCRIPPPVPVLIAARGPKMLSLAGEIADIAHLASLALEPKRQRADIDRVLAGAKRRTPGMEPLEIDLSITLSVSDDAAWARAEASRNAEQTIVWAVLAERKGTIGESISPEPNLPKELQEGLVSQSNVWKETIVPPHLEAMISDDILSNFAVAGTPEQCVTRLRSIAAKFPEVTGFRLKLPRPVEDAPYQHYADGIRQMGRVIEPLRSPVAAAA